MYYSLLMKIVFVASSNGLGHARRLLNLIAGFRDYDVSIVLFISSKQQKLLNQEILMIQKIKSFGICIVNPRGLEAVANDLNESESKWEDAWINEFNKASVVISDNSLWPTRYHNKVYLFGHFEWVTFFKKKAEASKLPTKVEDMVEQEIDLLSRISKWFRTRDFYIKSIGKLDFVEIPLLQYQSDWVASREQTQEIWLSNGTTGRNILEVPRTTSRNFEFIQKESWELSQGRMPLAILGRPGLGTIRDCLAYSICFSPAWSGLDPELSRNSLTLSERNLSIPYQRLISGDVDRYEIQKSQNITREYWKSASTTPNDVAEIILAHLK